MKHIKSHPPLFFDKVAFRSKQEQKRLVLRKMSEIGAKARRCAGVCNGASNTPRHNLHHHQNPVRGPVRPQTIPNLTPPTELKTSVSSVSGKTIGFINLTHEMHPF